MRERQVRTIRGIACAIAGSACWGYSGTCAEHLFVDYGVNELWLTCVRMLCASVMFFFLSASIDRKGLTAIAKDRTSLKGVLVYAVFGLLLCQISYMFTISLTNAATATIIQSLGIGVIMIYGCLSERRSPSFREGGALLLAVGGVYLICTNGNPSVLILPPEGIAWGGIAAVSFALYTLLPVKLLEKWNSHAIMAYSMLIGGLVLLPFSRIWAIPANLDLDAAISLVMVVVVGTVAAYGLFAQGVADAGSMRAGLFGSGVEPLSATVISIVWLGNRFSFATILGFALIVAMGCIITLGDRKTDGDAGDS